MTCGCQKVFLTNVSIMLRKETLRPAAAGNKSSGTVDIYKKIFEPGQPDAQQAATNNN
jgi:hypothetical protein